MTLQETEKRVRQEILYSAGNGCDLSVCFRSGLLARRVKMRALGIGSPTRWYFWPNAAVREFAGLLTAHRLKQALTLACIIFAYIGMTLLVYL